MAEAMTAMQRLDPMPMPRAAAASPLAMFPVRDAQGRPAQAAVTNLVQKDVLRNILGAAARVQAGSVGMIRPAMHEGAVAVVVGTGPSLDRRENRRAVKRLAANGAIVYALKSAATLLQRQGVPVHYVLNCDAQPSQVAKMPNAPGPTYLLGSCCDPTLFDHVLAAGARVEVFHSASGARLTEHGTEIEWYEQHFPHAWVAQGGMTVANRAVACAYYHGVAKVHVAGCDFGVRDRDRYYAQGATGRIGAGALWISDGGLMDGRPWYSQPSLVISAASLAKLAMAGFVEIIGDSLAAAMVRNPRALDRAVRKVA